jgi:hypothetical protein
VPEFHFSTQDNLFVKIYIKVKETKDDKNTGKKGFPGFARKKPAVRADSCRSIVRFNIQSFFFKKRHMLLSEIPRRNRGYRRSENASSAGCRSVNFVPGQPGMLFICCQMIRQAPGISH